MSKTNPDILALLRQIVILHSLDEAQLRLIHERVHHQHFPAGTLLFAQGDPGDSLYLIARGYIRVVLHSPIGREITMRVYGCGAVVGELAVFDGQPRSASAIVREDVTVLRLYREDLFDLMRRNFALVQSLLTMLAERLRFTTQRSQDLAFLSATQRLAGVLVQMAAQTGITSPPICLRVTQDQLAIDTGATREWINKALRHELHEIVRTQRGKVEILDLKKLCHWADDISSVGSPEQPA